MSALGGRLGAYREGMAERGGLEPAIERNIYADAAPDPVALKAVATRMRALYAAIGVIPAATLVQGRWPSL